MTPYASSSPISNAYLTGLYEQQVLTKMTELMAKTIVAIKKEPNMTWGDIQDMYRNMAELLIK